MLANRIFKIVPPLLVQASGLTAADPKIIDFDGWILEIIASVMQPSDSTAGKTDANAKRLYEGVEAFMELIGTSAGGTLPLTDGDSVDIRAIGGSSELPGKDVRIRVTRNAKLIVKGINLFTSANLDSLRLALTFRCFDEAYPDVEATK